MACKGLKPDTVIYTTLLQGLLTLFTLGRCDAAESLFDEMMCRGPKPNIVTYSVLLDGFLKNHKIVKAIEVFRSMQDQAKGLKSNVKIYNAMISGPCKENLLDEAEELLLQMEGDGCPPNDLTYNIVVWVFLKKGNKPKGMMLLQEMINKNFSPDASTMATLIDLLLAGGGDSDYLKMIHNLASRDRKTMS
ncbi:pentatricopeptide repeat-containing protein At1g63330-like [Rhododendron vialii]|uniref:pentatricopeptide repeat-containing protein At1g63330-like n=1 Tax=Rhododendron vialii TaxID=182163 RepID=UPI00265FC809|nr:pentatricopeptide repeat-containing protein At1g63330-like [Rhododendron vialii]